jgi:hypothetical protein
MRYLLILLTVMFFTPAQAQKKLLPADTKATAPTRNLLNHLNQLRQQAYLFGHQDDLAYGVKWKYQPGRSDVKEVAGDYPALYGWELSHLELDEAVNIDTVPFNNIRQYIKEVYERGGVNTISWHGTNPLTGKSAWDPAPGSIAAALPGGTKHEVYRQQLDKIANFLNGLKGKHGELIPILYRPLHELTGGWFWWGKNSGTAEEFKQLYRFTVHYLKDVKQLHNLLYVYNTGTEFNSVADYLERYPGDDVVDVVSFDTYQTGDSANGAAFAQLLSSKLTVLEQAAAQQHKVPAIGETGYNLVPDANWWTQILAKGIAGHHIAYVMLWRNAGYKKQDNTMEYYMPYTGHTSAADFRRFYQLPQTLFQKEVTQLKVYGNF